MQKSTLLLQDEKALEKIKKGVDIIYGAVKRTLGPEAGTTLMYRTYNRGPRNVDDGFYTAEVIMPKDPHVRLVSEFFKEATMRTNRKVGDGTSATTTIAGVLFNDVYRKLQGKQRGYSAGAKTETKGVMQLKREILAEAKPIKEAIKAASKPIADLKDLEKISAISLGEDSELSKTVAKMAFEVGIDGFIDVVEGYKGEVETEIVKGMRFPAKTCGKAFITKPERFEMEIENCPIFITNHKLDNDMLVRYMISTFNVTNIILVAPDFSDDVLVNMVLARKENGTFVWPVKAPALRTEIMEDMAVYCGATLCDKNAGGKLQAVTPLHLGFVEKLIVKDAETREDAILIGGTGSKDKAKQVDEEVEEKGKKVTKKKIVKTNAIQERIEILRGQLAETKEPQFKKLLERRIASMASAGGIIRVGSPTDAETLPLKLKVEDDVFACRAALRSGYVPGGGLCLKKIADDLPDTHILKEALLAPYNQIQENAGGSLEIGKDVIDPADAVYYAVEYATSVVASLITVKNLIPEEPELAHEEGNMAISRAILLAVFAWKRQQGIMTDNEKEQDMDLRGGLTEDEFIRENQD